MKEMKTQLILFFTVAPGSTAWAQQPCLSQEAYREKWRLTADIETTKTKDIGQFGGAKDSPYRFPCRKST